MPIANTKDNLQLCEYLVGRRKFMKISPSDLSFKTGIPSKYIKKIETGEWLDLPPGVYVKGFLKKYAKVVGLDESEVAQRFDLEIFNLKKTKPFSVVDNVSRKSLKKKFFTAGFLKSVSLRTIIFSVVAFFILIYIGWQFSVVLKKPNISITNLAEDIVVSEPRFSIEGKISAGDTLTINNEPVYAERDGSFKKEIELLSGMNVLEIKSISRFGKESKIIRRITYQQ
jgi:cytoskeletal protein RodZ